MKNITLALSILALGSLSSCTVSTPAQQTTYSNNYPQDLTYQQFYDDLSPYGQWIDYPGYGYVWAPTGVRGFKPYATNGYWVYADVGWTWVSGYSWGWAPFHYGRWFFDNMYGWVWVPGNEWAPAWVNWRSGGEYYGWAPMAPEFNNGYPGYGYSQPANSWCFVPQQYITNRNMNNYYVNESNNVTIINRTTIINNTNVVRTNTYTGQNPTRQLYGGGPDPRDVERVTRVSVTPVVTREGSRPTASTDNNGQLTIFRPRVNAPATTNTQRPAPSRVEPFRGNAQQNSNTEQQADNRFPHPVFNGNAPTQTPAPRENNEPGRRANNGNGQPTTAAPPVTTPPQQPVNNGNDRRRPDNGQSQGAGQRNNQQATAPANNGQPVQQPVNNNPGRPSQRGAQPPVSQPVRTPVMKPVSAPANNPNMMHPQPGRPASEQAVRSTSARPVSNNDNNKKEEPKQQQQPQERHQ